MVPTDPQKLEGNWERGVALDLHTVSSELLPNGSFNTQHTEIGELLYQVKYCGNLEKISNLVEMASEFIRKSPDYRTAKAIIPVPPSDFTRPFQPVQEIATRIGIQVGIPVLSDYVIKEKQTRPLKTVNDTQGRREQLRGAFRVRDLSLAGKGVLLFDDLFRSGETLKAVTNVLKIQGKVARVFVLTITKTRTKR